MKTPGIPIWTSFILGFIALFCVITSALALTGNEVNALMGPAWAGRNLALALISLLAIFWKSPVLYIAAFLGSICREIGDMVEIYQSEPTSIPLIIFAAGLLPVWAYGLTCALKTGRKI